MKLQQIIFAVIISLSSILISNAQVNHSIIKGKVVNWPTDTVYLQTMPFYSPHSCEMKLQIVADDSTFSFELENRSIPWVVQLYSNKSNIELNKEQLLFLNYTDDYYYGHCVKFYTYGASTFLLEPGKVLNVELKSKRALEKLSPEMAEYYRKAGAKVLNANTIEQVYETEIQFSGEDSFQYKYFQKALNIADKIDNRLELYQNKPIGKAIESYAKIREKLLDNLEGDRKNLSPLFYEYINAEIEFGARVEFLKFLLFSRKEEDEISQDIIDIIEFNKDGITPVIMASEAYNKYLELYLNFKINVQNKRFSAYNKFSMQKCKAAIWELPVESVYYYLAGQLLQTLRTEDFAEDIVIEVIMEFPDGELNDKLMEKYDL